MLYLFAGLYARVPLLARAQDQRQRACKALTAARASVEGAQKVRACWPLHETQRWGCTHTIGLCIASKLRAHGVKHDHN